MASDPLQFLTATMTVVTPSAASLLTALLACCSPADRQSGSHYSCALVTARVCSPISISAADLSPRDTPLQIRSRTVRPPQAAAGSHKSISLLQRGSPVMSVHVHSSPSGCRWLRPLPPARAHPPPSGCLTLLLPSARRAACCCKRMNAPPWQHPYEGRRFRSLLPDPYEGPSSRTRPIRLLLAPEQTAV